MRTSGNMLHLTMINKINVPDEHSWDATVCKALELISLSSAEGWKNSPKLIRSMPFLDLSSLSKVMMVPLCLVQSKIIICFKNLTLTTEV